MFDKYDNNNIKVGSFVQIDAGDRIGKVLRIEKLDVLYVDHVVREIRYTVEFGPEHDNIISPFTVPFGDTSTFTVTALGIGQGLGSIIRVFN